MVAKITSALLACLLLLGAAIPCAADNANGKSDLSATATESYQIRNQKFGDLLRPEGANGAVGTRIVLYPAEPWKCMTWKLQPVGESAFHVQNHFTAKTFSVKAADAEKQLVQIAFASEASERPAWQFTKLPDGSYRISEAKSGEVLTAVGGADGTVHIVLASWQDRAEQKWGLEKMDLAKLTM